MRADKAKHQENIASNMNHLNNLKDKSAVKNGVNMQLSVWWRSLITKVNLEFF